MRPHDSALRVQESTAAVEVKCRGITLCIRMAGWLHRHPQTVEWIVQRVRIQTRGTFQVPWPLPVTFSKKSSLNLHFARIKTTAVTLGGIVCMFALDGPETFLVGCALVHSDTTVSYTHLTLPTILLV